MRNGSTNKKRNTENAAEEPISIQRSSGNVFADLDLPHPEIALAKAKLVQRIREVISDRKLTQVKAAQLLQLDQSKVSALIRGQVQGYSIDRLFRFLNALGQHVEIVVTPIEDAHRGHAVVVS
ncbi:MAG: helix-turn-helix transcriptional regulator [Planctomycetota bacterium]